MSDTATTTPIDESRASRSATTTEIRDQLKADLGLGNVMEVPRLEKIVVNMGVGEAVGQSSLLDARGRPT